MILVELIFGERKLVAFPRQSTTQSQKINIMWPLNTSCSKKNEEISKFHQWKKMFLTLFWIKNHFHLLFDHQKSIFKVNMLKFQIFFRRPSNAGASNSLILLGQEEDSFQTLAFWEVLELPCKLSALSCLDSFRIIWILLDSFRIFCILLESFVFF